jgi:hypothetical protein
MPEPVRNRQEPWALTEDDVQAALERIAGRDEELAQEAEHVYGTLTWGEGPGQIRQAAVQDWLWYQLPTKYFTDENGYMGRLAATAAELFDELGLDAYAAVCRSEVTAGVHAAFDQSDALGFKAMRKARAGSGIEPPDLDDFAWGEVMGLEEALARSSVENTLERAIAEGPLQVGVRGWRGRQREITATQLDGDHPSQPGQSWRTTIITERIGEWVRSASARSEELGRRRAAIASRLLHPITPPADVAERVAPLSWLLDVFGDEQALTQAGYLNRPFVVLVQERRPWEDPFASDGLPRTETDVIMLHRLRGWLESVGALRKRGKKLRRTERGAAMAADPMVAWGVLTNQMSGNPWDRFVVDAAGLVLLERGGEVSNSDLIEAVAADAVELGWRTSDHGMSRVPTDRDVSSSFYGTWPLLRLFGFVAEHGDWGSRGCSVPPAGESTMLAIIRAGAAGPRTRLW